MTKTVFIIVTRGFIVRNILRTGVLDLLKKSGCHVVIFFPKYTHSEVPKYLRDEFEDDQVTLKIVSEPKKKRVQQKIYKVFSKFSSQLVFTLTTWKYNLIGKKSKMERGRIWSHIEKYAYTILSKIHILKSIARWAEQNLFRDEYYGIYFNEYKPDVVFSTSIMSKLDIQFMKEAKRRGIKTVSMPKGWDNVAKLLYRVVPDVAVFHNEVMKKHAVSDQRMNEKKIVVTGFPQFDMYTDTSLFLSREEYCKKIGINPTSRILFFGSEGGWSPKDDAIVDILARFVKESQSTDTPIGLIVRPHYSDIKLNRYERFKNVPNVWVDDTITISDFFWDNWDPGLKETHLFMNALYHSDIVINIASTLALDGAALGKPVIGVGFGALYHPKTGKDITALVYESDHYQSVLATGAVDFVKNEEDLKRSIDDYIENPERKKEERKKLIDMLCYKIDGNSSKRIADVILFT